MKIKISQTDQWVSDGRSWVRGSAFLSGDYYRAEELVTRMQTIQSVGDFKQFITKLNGYYAIIHPIGDGEVCAAVDHVRSIPLFYSDGSNNRTIQDSVFSFPKGSINPLAEREFLLTMYVTGSDTATPGLKQLEAGTMIHSTPDNSTIHTHTDYHPTDLRNNDEEELLEKLSSVMDGVTNRVIRMADGRPIWVLLSGGIDSRLILLHLLKQGYEDITALTFGRPNAHDAVMSKEVCDNLGIDRVFVEYSGPLWHDVFHSDDMDAYYTWLNNGDSLPGLQAFPALKSLTEDDRIPEDCVFLPGQTIAGIGATLPSREDIANSRRNLIDHILDTHYCLWRYDDFLEISLQKRIDDRLPSPTDPLADYSKWEWRERQSKFLSQDGQCYAFWGYDWWYPLFDKELVTFWETVPVSQRRGKALMREYTTRLYASIADIDRSAASETEATVSLYSRLKQWVGSSPAEPLARRFHGQYVLNPDRGGMDPLAILGILSEGQYTRLFTGIESHHSFRTMHATGRMSFEPPHEHGVPANSTLTLDSD